jgi:amino acid transporter
MGRLIDPPLPPDDYTGETVATMATVPTLIVFCVAVAVFAFWSWRRTSDDLDRPLWLFTGIGFTVIAASIGALLWWGMYPWQAEYHQWRAVAGTVATVNSRLTATDVGTMQDKYVVTFQGNAQEYGVLDTRAAAVRPGDKLTITCVRRWQWSGAHGYDCNFVDAVRKQPR